MNKIKSMIHCFFIISLLLLLIPYPFAMSSATKSTQHRNTNITSDYDNPIDITSNSDFAFEASLRGWAGNGTEMYPYIIEGYHISSGRAIEISTTTAYFIIRDCTLGDISEYRALYLYGVSNGEIYSVTFHGHDAIYVDYCQDILFHDDDCQGDAVITHSSSIHLTDNSLRLRLSCLYSTSSTINHNEIYSFWMLYSDNFTVEYNDFNNDFFIYCGHHTVKDNRLDGKVLGYFQDLNNKTIDVTKYGIIILQSCEDIIIKNGYFEGTHACVTIYDSIGCRIIDNDFIDCDEPILIWSSTDCEITDNFVKDVGVGVHLGESIGCIMSGNKIISCDKGIQIERSSDGYINDNYIVSSTSGIVADSCNGFEINGNYICGCQYTSINLFNATAFSIFNNEFGWNGPPYALDNEGTNLWDNGVSVGNNWSSYNGEGNYTIDGSSRSVDHFPSVFTDNELPVIQYLDHTPEDPYSYGIITVITNATDNNGIAVIQIEISSNNNKTWVLYDMTHEDNQWVYSEVCTGPTFNYRVIAYDWAGNQVTSKIVYIQLYNTSSDTTSTTTTHTTRIQLGSVDLLVAVGGLVAIALIITGFVKRHRH